MKLSQLKQIIKESVKEVLTENAKQTRIKKLREGVFKRKQASKTSK